MNRNISAILVLVVALPIALILGSAAAQDQVETAAVIMGVLFLVTCLVLGKHIWLLIPWSLALRGDINFLPGSPAPWHLMTATVLGFTLLRVATRQQHLKFRWTGLETVLFLVALTIFQAFARNPTGFALLGGAYAGGKPYILFGVALTAFTLVGMADADLKSWKWAVLGYILFGLMDGLLATASVLSPSLSSIVIRFYSNVSLDAAMGQQIAGIGDSRLHQLGQIGGILALVATSFWRPVAAIDLRKPWRAAIAGGGILISMLSGSRGLIARVVVMFITGSLIRRKPLDVFVVGVAGMVLLAGVIGANLVRELPYGAQRALSFLPVEVRADVRTDATGSSEGRFEVWKLALGTDRYISNKLLGDGFQLSASEQAARMAFIMGDVRMRKMMSKTDIYLASGSYHGFHVETIRFTGVVGLIAATAALITLAVFAARCIRYFEGRDCWGYVIFLCMPFLIHPWWYWLVFGSYKTEFPRVLAVAGMIKLLWMIKGREEAAASEVVEVADEQPKERMAIPTGGRIPVGQN
ncbi:MAG: hypothetical protein AAGI48_07260 [Verrucomicrobiota bacterium]